MSVENHVYISLFYRLNDKLSSNTNFGHFRWLKSKAQVFIS